MAKTRFAIETAVAQAKQETWTKQAPKAAAMVNHILFGSTLVASQLQETTYESSKIQFELNYYSLRPNKLEALLEYM